MDSSTDWEPPRSWALADALERVAREWDWEPILRGTSPDEVEIVFRRRGARPRREPLYYEPARGQQDD